MNWLKYEAQIDKSTYKKRLRAFKALNIKKIMNLSQNIFTQIACNLKQKGIK